VSAKQDAEFMRLALREARRGHGRTHPNPLVGAVIARGGKVVSTGFHARAGAPHAEAVAIAAAGKRARGATLYSTLEPCNHHGRTPPCTEAIIRAGIKRVVFGSEDPNPHVDGEGHRALVDAGIEVVAHVLADETDALNEPFVKGVTVGVPFVTLKAAMSLDGKIATKSGRSKWITSEASREEAHRLRNLVDAIVVGAGTVRADNPRLTTRLPGGRTPVRIVLDSHLRSRPSANVFREDVSEKTIIATTEPLDSARARAFTRRGIELWSLPSRKGRVSLVPLLKKVAAKGWFHVLVEGGAEVHQSFLEQRLADELVLFVAPKLLGGEGLTWTGRLACRSVERALKVSQVEVATLGDDFVIRARFPRRNLRNPRPYGASSVAPRMRLAAVK
jgi:diaminohydroxyphosphoribosylaminopyrimidine deaminase/5-amino-6-(5-phosphoribosylamino)uracil reductase